MYEEMAEALGTRPTTSTKPSTTIGWQCRKIPTASFLVEDIAELYRASGRIREAVLEAEQAIKTNPNDLNARRVLARIYTQQIGDSSAKPHRRRHGETCHRAVQVHCRQRSERCRQPGDAGPSVQGLAGLQCFRGSFQEGAGCRSGQRRRADRPRHGLLRLGRFQTRHGAVGKAFRQEPQPACVDRARFVLRADSRIRVGCGRL